MKATDLKFQKDKDCMYKLYKLQFQLGQLPFPNYMAKLMKNIEKKVTQLGRLWF